MSLLRCPRDILIHNPERPEPLLLLIPNHRADTKTLKGKGQAIASWPQHSRPGTLYPSTGFIMNPAWAITSGALISRPCSVILEPWHVRKGGVLSWLCSSGAIWAPISRSRVLGFSP